MNKLLDLQLDALRQADCEQVFTDTVSGMQAHRPNWEKLLTYTRPGDNNCHLAAGPVGRFTKYLLRSS